jgi:putative transposase
MKRLCNWFGIARSSIYYKPSISKRQVSKALDPVLVEKVRSIIEANPTYGVRRVTALLRRELQKAVNRKKVHRIMKVNNWQVRKKPSGFKQRAKGMRSEAFAPNERWAKEFCKKHVIYLDFKEKKALIGPAEKVHPISK